MKKIKNDRSKYVTRAALVTRGPGAAHTPSTRTAADYRNAIGDDDGYITFRRPPPSAVKEKA
jgi:hypothetical protein